MENCGAKIGGSVSEKNRVSEAVIEWAAALAIRSKTAPSGYEKHTKKIKWKKPAAVVTGFFH